MVAKGTSSYNIDRLCTLREVASRSRTQQNIYAYAEVAHDHAVTTMKQGTTPNEYKPVILVIDNAQRKTDFTFQRGGRSADMVKVALAHGYVGECSNAPIFNRPTAEQLEEYKDILYVPTDDQNQLINEMSRQGIANLCRCANLATVRVLSQCGDTTESVMQWAKMVPDSLKHPRPEIKMDKIQFIASPDDETSNVCLLTALFEIAPQNKGSGDVPLQRHLISGDQSTLVNFFALRDKLCREAIVRPHARDECLQLMRRVDSLIPIMGNFHFYMHMMDAISRIYWDFWIGPVVSVLGWKKNISRCY